MKVDLEKVKEFGNIELLAKQMVEGFITGLHRSPYHGFSVEFAEHRLYNTGESTRHMDWKVFSKTDRLYVKRYEEETNLRCQVVIDNSSSMYYPVENFGKIRFSVLASAALAYLLHKQRDAVGLFTFSDKIELQTQTKSTTAHINKLFVHLGQLLRETQGQKQTKVASVIHQIADKIHRRSLVLIFSDMFQDKKRMDEIFSALQHLKHNKHEVLLFHVTDKITELDFDFEDRPYEFVDLESDTRLKLTPTDIKTTYRTKIDQYYNELKLRCGQLKIDFIEADVKDDFDKILSSYLIKRSRMR